MRLTTGIRGCVAGVGLAFMLARPALAPAQDTASEQLFTRLSDRSLERILDNLNIRFDRRDFNGTDGKRLSLYNVTMKNNWKATLINHNSSLQFVSGGFKTGNNQDVAIERMNEWNQRRRHSRAFVDRNGFGVLEADLDFFGGTNQKIITEWIRLYDVSLSDFANFTR